MENILTLAALALLAVVTILLIVLLVRQNRSLTEQKQHQQKQAQYLQNLAYDLFDELDHQRDEHAAALSDGNTALLNTLTQLGQSQSGLLESMQRQVLLSTRNQEERAGQMAASVTASLSQLDARMETLRQANDRQLAEMRRTVDEKLTESIDKRLNDSFAQVSQRLEQVYKSLGEMQTLAVGVGDLKKVLTNVKTRGIWGEMQLGSLLSAMLAPGQYDENVAVIPGSAERVEFAVRLPGKEADVLYLPIDSKFPQEDYLRLMEASQSGDAAAADAARKALIQRIKQEARRIASKYVAPPHTTDFAIMFLPIEGLYAEVVQTPDLCESIQREHRIVVAGPSTFSALLNALQMGFRTLAIEKRSSEVWSLLGSVKNDFDKFAEVLEKTRQRLVQATESIDTAFTRTRSIQRRLGAVETPEDE
ncbi:MAG: DNA recombination protein RmuC [Clostridia bacterium]|nr:DNA recombination protein RmuC [Clostridia bacterium]